MSKKKKVKTNKSNKNKFVSIIRTLYIIELCSSGDFLHNNIEEEQCLNRILEFKNSYKNYIDTDYLLEPNNKIFIDIIDSCEELIMFYYICSDFNTQKNRINYYKDKIVSEIKEMNIGYELLVNILHITNVAKKNVTKDDLKKITHNSSEIEMYNVAKYSNVIYSFINTFTEYVMSYVEPIKNYKIERLSFSNDNHIEIKYMHVPVLLQDDISRIKNLLLGKYDLDTPIAKKILNMSSNVEDSFVKAFNNFELSEIGTKIEDIGEMNFLQIDINEYELPLQEYLGNIDIDADLNLLSKFPRERLYAQSKFGTRFEFLEKKQNINYIDFKESKKFIYCIVNVLNNGSIKLSNGLLVDTDIEDYKEIIYNDNSINLEFIIDKRNLLLLKSIKDKILLTMCNNYTAKDDNKTLLFMMYINKLIWLCLYMIYYNPNLFKDKIKMYTCEKNKTTGYIKKYDYRVAHLRRLPSNCRASSEALVRAKESNFIVPDGYTYVQEFNRNNNYHKRKIIKINA